MVEYHDKESLHDMVVKFRVTIFAPRHVLGGEEDTPEAREAVIRERSRRRGGLRSAPMSLIWIGRTPWTFPSNKAVVFWQGLLLRAFYGR